jgi:hypothetical protein
MKNHILYSFLCLFVASSCATSSVMSTGIIEETYALIQGNKTNGNDLLGLSIKANDFIINSVKSADLYKDKSQSSNQINESSGKQRSIKVPLNPGTTNITIFRNGAIIYSKDIYVASGQIRRIQLKL